MAVVTLTLSRNGSSLSRTPSKHSLAAGLEPATLTPQLFGASAARAAPPPAFSAAQCLRPRLFIGSREAEADAAFLQAAGISHVLQVGVELAPTWPATGRRVYTRLAVADTETQDIVAAFEEAFRVIDDGRAAGAVLVHCAQGVSRSAAVLIGYLMSREGLSYEAALAQLQAVRPQVQPNPGFVMQLREFERLGAQPGSWRGWSQAAADAAFAAASVSRRREVCGLSDMIRAFHMADVDEEDCVFDARHLLL